MFRWAPTSLSFPALGTGCESVPAGQLLGSTRQSRSSAEVIYGKVVWTSVASIIVTGVRGLYGIGLRHEVGTALWRCSAVAP